MKTVTKKSPTMNTVMKNKIRARTNNHKVLGGIHPVVTSIFPKES